MCFIPSDVYLQLHEGPVSSILLCPLSYTAPEVFGTGKRNLKDYVPRLPTQSFDQRPGNIRQSTLILPPSPLWFPFSSWPTSPLTRLISVGGVIKPCGTAVGLPLPSCRKVRKRQIKRLWNTSEIKKKKKKSAHLHIVEDALLFFDPYPALK